MNDPRQRAIEAWLEAGPDRGPEDGLAHALEVSFATRQRPGWATSERWLAAVNISLPLRTLAMPRFAILLLVVAAIVAALAVGLLAAGQHKPVLLPIGPARPGVILFADSNAIWQADATGGGAHQVVTASTRLRSPTFSPTERRSRTGRRSTSRTGWSRFSTSPLVRPSSSAAGPSSAIPAQRRRWLGHRTA